MTLSASSLLLETPGSFLIGRTALTRGTMLLQYSITQIVNGFSRGAPVMEATQNIPKRFSTVLRDSGTGLGAILTPSIIASLTVQIKKGGLTSYSVITPTLTAIGSSGLVDVALTAGHLDTLGVAALNITGPGILPNDELIIDVFAINKNDPVRAGLSAMPNANAGSVGGLPTVGATIPSANAGTAAGLALKQDVDSAVASATSSINAHTDVVGASILSSTPSAASIRDAVLDALLADHSTPGSLSDGVAIAAGLLQGNFFMDSVVNDANGQTSARLRLWRDEGGAAGATSGGSGEGEFATFQVTTTYAGPGKVSTHRVVRVVST